MEIHSNYPYLDDYDVKKGYTQILSVPGRPLQAREFTQAQTILRDHLERLGKAVLPEGIVTGCSVTVDSNTVTVTSGTVFIDGLVRYFDGGIIGIDGAGEETVGLKISTAVVTSTQDESLLDPSNQTKNYKKPGASREKQVLSLVANDVSSVVIAKFNDGDLITSAEAHSASASISDVDSRIASNCMGVFGNYIDSGLEVVSLGQQHESVVYIVSAGKAMVEGSVVELHSDTTLVTTPCGYEGKVLGEEHSYSSEGVKLNREYVLSIDRVDYNYRFTEEVEKGSADSFDTLYQEFVTNVVSVSMGGIIYTRDVDYTVSGNKISWIVTGEAPMPGNLYTVVYDAYVEDVDVTYSYDSGRDQFIIQASRPLGEGESIKVYYTYNLYRRDFIYLSTDGVPFILETQGADREALQNPFGMSDGFLLAYVDVCRYDTHVVLADTRKVSYSDLMRLDKSCMGNSLSEKDEVLVIEAKSLASGIKGIFVDKFNTVEKVDLVEPALDCCVDLDNEELTTSYVEDKVKLQVEEMSGVTESG